MPIVSRIYECEKFGTKYLLEKLSNDHLILYKIGQYGMRKKVQEKIYTQTNITRKAYFQRNSQYNPPTSWDSRVPRLNKIVKEGQLSCPFSIQNKGDIENINFVMSGYVDKNGKIKEIDRFDFKVFDISDNNSCPPLSNLARRYIRKLGSIFLRTPPNKWTYNMKPSEKNILNE